MSPTRRTLALAAVSAALLAGCASAPQPKTVTDTVAATPQLSTLNKLINEAGMADTLRGAGPFTVFAPSDEAFKAVPAKTLADLSANKEMLKSVLGYHVVPSTITSAEARNGNVKSLQGANLALSKAGTFVTVEDAVVQQPDVVASNGVVHIIDKVMMPPKP